MRLDVTATPNFFFTKYNAEECFDLRGYDAIQFDLLAPVGSEGLFTLTQMAEDCTTRLLDSTYTPLSRYITPNGQVQTVYQPLSDFALNVEGGAFDFQHLKDWTFVNLAPIGAEFVISNYVLRGNCTTGTEPGTATVDGSTENAEPTIDGGDGDTVDGDDNLEGAVVESGTVALIPMAGSVDITVLLTAISNF
jgi:hypothetical protein